MMIDINVKPRMMYDIKLIYGAENIMTDYLCITLKDISYLYGN